MSAEWLTAIGSIGTLVVIAATVITAVIQLRHMRGGNQIAALTEMRETIESDRFVNARERIREISSNIGDLQFRQRLMRDVLEPEHAAVIGYVGNVFETLGCFVKYGIIEKTIACDLWGGVAVQTWQRMLPIVAMRRRLFGPAIWENFEYFVVLGTNFWHRNQDGAFPKAVGRLEIPDDFLEADRAANIVPERWRP
ncbi:MAG: hypothetical protein M3Z37_01590 [Candidatus Eremiobacteraeota bacterium]|nr:hypothetical protein [Candidatus Eremiobacteraeota bacterium]